MASGRGLDLVRTADCGAQEKGKLLRQMHHENVFQAPLLVVIKEGGSGRGAVKIFSKSIKLFMNLTLKANILNNKKKKSV